MGTNRQHNTTTIMSSSTTATSKHHGHHTTVKDAGIHQHKTVVDKHVHEHPVVEKHIHEHPVKEEHIHQHPITETHKDAATTVTKKDIGVDGPLVDGKTKIHQSSEKEVIKTHVHGTAVDKHVHEHPVVEKHLEVHPVAEEHIHEHPVTEKHIHRHPITETHKDVGVTQIEKTHTNADHVPKIDGKTHTHAEAKLKKTVEHKHKAVVDEHIHVHP